MGMRDYLTQLSFLGLVEPPAAGEAFLRQYEFARFSAQPLSSTKFQTLMASFADFLAGMTVLRPAIIDHIRTQGRDQLADMASETASLAPSQAGSTIIHHRTPSPSAMERGSFTPTLAKPLTARMGLSRTHTPLAQRTLPSQESLSSVIRRTPDDPLAAGESDDINKPGQRRAMSPRTPSLRTVHSEAGSVLRAQKGSDEVG